jgi:hypothetical protein
LRFLDQLAGYAVRLVLRVDQMVQSIVGSRLLALNRLRRGCREFLEDGLCLLEFALFGIRERQKSELQCLLRRDLPSREMLSELLEVESSAEVFRNSSPCLKAGVSLPRFL